MINLMYILFQLIFLFYTQNDGIITYNSEPNNNIRYNSGQMGNY